MVCSSTSAGVVKRPMWTTERGWYGKYTLGVRAVVELKPDSKFEPAEPINGIKAWNFLS